MSGVIKKIGDVAKKIIKNPIFKAVLVAAAIYFTAGIAAGAMGSTFAASLPGIGTAMETLGIAAPEVATATATLTEATASLTAADAVGAAASDPAMLGAAADGASLGADAAASITPAADAAGIVNANVATAPLDATASLSPSAEGAPQLSYGEPPTGTPAMQNLSAAPEPIAPETPVPTQAPASNLTAASDSVGGVNAPDGSIGNTEGSAARTTFDASADAKGAPGVRMAVAPGGSSFLQGLSQWWGGMDATTKQIVGTGLAHAGSSVVGAISANAKMNQEQGMFDTLQANKGRLPPKPGQYNGIINSQFSRPQPGG